MKKSEASIKNYSKHANNKRMFFIRRIDELKNENVERSSREIEVITDGKTIGECDFGLFYLCNWGMPYVDTVGQERKLCLRINETIHPLRDIPLDDFKKEGYYHGGDIVDEILALSSLFLRIRFKRGPTVRWDDKPHLTLEYKEWIDKSLVDGKRNLTDLSSWFELAIGLDDNLHQKFILASRLYHQAILIIEELPYHAYLNLISAIETLCLEQKIKKIELHELDPELAKLVDLIEDLELKTKIEQTILKRERLISRKFKEFIVEHTEKSFWEYEGRPKLGQINPDDLPKLLSKIYKLRSKTIHEGQPFPPYVFRSPLRGSEKEFPKGIIEMGKEWKEKDYIPNPHFFERLVNHVLKTYLKRNQKELRRTEPGNSGSL